VISVVPEAARRLLAALDAAIVGQDDAKCGLVLALVAREHAWLEGPPGCGKSALAEALCGAAGARAARICFHRDVRDSDLLGDARLERTVDGDVERIRRSFGAGPLEVAEVAVLDDLPRAPGEALAPLLRVLSERESHGRRLPLETAIATGAPATAEGYLDPLEPTQLDRFAVQVRMRPLVCGRAWRGAGELLAREAEPAWPAPLDRAERHALQAAAAALPVESAALAALRELAARFASGMPLAERALVSDRAFGRQALALLRAHALLRGSARVEPRDLLAVRYMVAGRLPAELLALVPGWIEQAMEHAPAHAGAPGASPTGQRAGESASAAPDSAPVVDVDRPESERAPGARGARPRAPARADVEPLLRAFEGRLERGRRERSDDPGGQPRRWRRLARLDEIHDADALDALLFAQARLPGWPRVARRERRLAGGMVAVLRDVSASMEGRLSRWAGEVVAGIVRLGARRRMRLGYVEFNHAAERHAAGGRFFHRRYRRLLGLAAARRAEGRTSYQAPLETALREFRGRAGRNRHVVMLTDGVPVVGDPTIAAERALARRLGVRIHTVFLGVGDCPAVLDLISRETGGLRFAARPGADGRLRVRERGIGA
jgi:MoxR-like ATPase